MRQNDDTTPELAATGAASGDAVVDDEPVRHRLTLRGKNYAHLPHAARWLRVVRGEAWATFAGRDYIIQAGEALALLSRRRDHAVVSSATRATVEIEVEL
ncbi:MAG: DUF2917 domain-containing protein [Chloroflexota bacterium]